MPQNSSCTFKSAELIRMELKYCQKTATAGGDMLHANNERAPLAAAKQLLTQTSAPGHSRVLNWSKLAVGSPERCPVCVKHIASHGGVLKSNMHKHSKINPLHKKPPTSLNSWWLYHSCCVAYISKVFLSINAGTTPCRLITNPAA